MGPRLTIDRSVRNYRKDVLRDLSACSTLENQIRRETYPGSYVELKGSR